MAVWAAVGRVEIQLAALRAVFVLDGHGSIRPDVGYGCLDGVDV